MSWITKLTPDTLVMLATLLGGAGTWFWHKIKGDNKDSFDDLLRGLGKQVIHMLLTDPDINSKISPKALTDLASKALWALAGRLNVPKNSITEALATSVIAHSVGDIMEELRALDAMPNQVKQLSDKVNDVVKVFDDAKNSPLVKQSEQFGKDYVEKDDGTTK
jgi:hypothetical protein